MIKEPLDAQKDHWGRMFVKNNDMFGTEPSYPARKAAEMFKREDKKRILELGGGQGRDTLFFAQEGFQIYTLDYTKEGVEEIKAKADKYGPISVCYGTPA
jgi:2-polyprenyl-3-methyl-5-hydroxy-6-metoxy-1,4-benzoquinol methylase